LTPPQRKEDECVEKIVPIREVTGTGVKEAYRRPLRELVTFIANEVYAKYIGTSDDVLALFSLDGRRTGKRRSHFLFTVGLLNVGDLIRSPKHRFVVLLSTGGESYEELEALLPELRSEIDELIENGINVGGRHHRVTAHMCADWKVLNCILGLGAANSKIYCPWCLGTKDERTGAQPESALVERQFVWQGIVDGELELIEYGHINLPLLPAISPEQIWIDLLHLFLRITDTLLGLLMEDITAMYVGADKAKLVDAFEEASNAAGCRIRLEDKDGKLSWPPLMGDQKERLFRCLNMAAFLPERRAVATRALWNEFLEIMDIAKSRELLTHDAIEQFRSKVHNWVTRLTAPSTGALHDPTFMGGMYASARVTPYMHALTKHVPDQLARAALLGQPLSRLNCEPVEKMHHLQNRLYFSRTSMDGGRGKRKSSATKALMKMENRRTFAMATPPKSGRAPRMQILRGFRKRQRTKI
jgi:hypothetical protein